MGKEELPTPHRESDDRRESIRGADTAQIQYRTIGIYAPRGAARGTVPAVLCCARSMGLVERVSRRVAATVRRSVCYCEKSSKHASKACARVAQVTGSKMQGSSALYSTFSFLVW